MPFLRPILKKEAKGRAGGWEEAYSGSFRRGREDWMPGGRVFCSGRFRGAKPGRMPARRENRSGRFRRASMTVECALALPFTLMIVLVLASYMNAVAFQLSKSLALSNTARKAAALAGVMEGEYDGGWIDLCVPRRYEYPCSFLGLGGVTVATRARVFPWVGKAPGEETGENSGKQTVYVTENRSVYHTYADCSHLDLTIYETTLDKVGGLRNSDGKRYKPCSGFPAGYKGPVYVSKSGDYYYPTLDRAALTRHVSMVSEDECGDLCICSRCAARAAAEAQNAA